MVDRQQDLMHMKYSYINNNRLRTLNEGDEEEEHSLLRRGAGAPANITADNFLSGLKSKSDRSRSIARGRQTSHNSLPVSYELTRRTLPKIELELKPTEVPEHVKIAMWKTGHNTMAPFASLGKPTCGYFFTRNVSHKKRLIGINATNTVKWRSNVDILNIKKDYKKTI